MPRSGLKASLWARMGVIFQKVATLSPIASARYRARKIESTEARQAATGWAIGACVTESA